MREKAAEKIRGVEKEGEKSKERGKEKGREKPGERERYEDIEREIRSGIGKGYKEIRGEMEKANCRERRDQKGY